jgi:hypothetical protein
MWGRRKWLTDFPDSSCIRLVTGAKRRHGKVWEEVGVSKSSPMMIRRGSRRLAWGLIAILALPAPAFAQDPKSPTAEEYAAHAGGEVTIVPAGAFKLDGIALYCGTRPTVIDNNLDDYGAAYPGFLIMNMRLLSRVTTPVKLWIYSHECGHQFRGPDEETADCFAVQRGRRQGWLSPGGVEEICQFIAPAKGDAMHFSGSHRCDYMRQCFTEYGIR